MPSLREEEHRSRLLPVLVGGEATRPRSYLIYLIHSQHDPHDSNGGRAQLLCRA